MHTHSAHMYTQTHTRVHTHTHTHTHTHEHAHTHTRTHARAHTRTCLLADTGNRKLLIAAVARMRMVSLRLDSNCRGILQTQSLPSKKAQRTLNVRCTCPLHTPLGVVSTPRSQSAWSGAAVESVTRRGRTSEQPPSSQTPLPAGQRWRASSGPSSPLAPLGEGREG